MNFGWLSWDNPVAIWWGFLLGASTINIALWLVLYRQLYKQTPPTEPGTFRVKLMVLLCAAYVFGCAFRSVLPRADVQRICLFDTWLSSVLVGRSVATVAEICFIIQWALVLRYLARMVKSDAALHVANVIVPLIIVAELFSWYAVITTSYLGNTVENSIWALTFLMIAGALLRLLYEFRGIVRFAMVLSLIGVACYLAFLVIVDVPMYFGRWRSDLTSGKELLGLFAGLHDAGTRWIVTHDFAQWQDEIVWMSLYFSAAVWGSLALCSFGLLKCHLPRYCGTARQQSSVSGPAARHR